MLTPEAVIILEPTGGTSAATHLVPFTAPLQREIRRAVAPWIADLARHVPGVLDGPAYWSVSPAMPSPPEAKAASGGVPVGFLDDAAYLSPLHRMLSSAALAVPGDVRQIADPDAFRYVTLRLLVGTPGLGLVSVWNPTFFSLLLAPLRDWADRLASDLASGDVRAEIPDALRAKLRQRPDPARARLLADAVRDPDDAALHRALWPRLRLVSAWADAHARTPFEELAALLPHAHAQPKGLVATEGVVSIPRVGREGAALAVTSHVFEFEPLAGGRPRWADELARGEQYQVLLTTAGGLTRYRLGDVVEVVGHEQACPLIRFVGRATPVSDRVGEKLHDAPVRAALAETLAEIPHRFALLAPDGDATPAAYVLFVETDADDRALAEASGALDARLGANVHYAHARRLGQLGPVRAFRIARGGAQAYLDGCVSLGQRMGDVKPAALHRDGAWAGRFTGAFVEGASG